MKAAWISGHGGNEVVEIGNRPAPVLQPGQVLIRVKAATLNRVDLYMRDSGAGITHTLPQILGLDGAGTVEAVGDGESLVRPGQDVVIHPGIRCGRCEFCQRGDSALCLKMSLLGEHRDGTFAELICVPAENAFPMPSSLSYVQASALGVNHLTAWRMLFTKAQLQPWETVLIFGVGGGVSLAALQLAKLVGASVIVTSRDDQKLGKARLLGADHGINSLTSDIVKSVMEITSGRGVDVVIENVGAAAWSSAMKSLVRGGRLITCGATTGDQPPADLRRIFIRQLQILGSTLGSLDEFDRLLELVNRRGLKPVVDSEFPLDELHAALSRLESGNQFGKVALSIA